MTLAKEPLEDPGPFSSSQSQLPFNSTTNPNHQLRGTWPWVQRKPLSHLGDGSVPVLSCHLSGSRQVQASNIISTYGVGAPAPEIERTDLTGSRAKKSRYHQTEGQIRPTNGHKWTCYLPTGFMSFLKRSGSMPNCRRSADKIHIISPT